MPKKDVDPAILDYTPNVYIYCFTHLPSAVRPLEATIAAELIRRNAENISPQTA